MQTEPRRDSQAGAFKRALDRQTVSPPPVWLMRQAGRYLPEYRQLRAEVPSFLDLCFDLKRAAAITLQPVDRFDLDAAILFSDILTIPFALGRRVTFVEGEGPQLDPIDAAGIGTLDGRDVVSRLARVLDIASEVRGRLAPGKALVGFAGAPWTVATYMVAGGGSPDQLPARLMARTAPDLFGRLIDLLADVTADYLVAQLRAGADVVQIFDSWAGILDEEGFARWCIAPTKRVVDRLRSAVPGAKIIGFPRGAGLRVSDYVEATGIDAISIDWTVPLGYARQRLQPTVTVQGNLDPVTLLAGGEALDAAVDRILASLGSGPFIFNLGHGVLPETPPAHVERLVRRVRGTI